MNELDTGVPARGGRMRIPRSRGATSGFLLILLGIWGALIPFIGPFLHFAWGTDQAWTWTDPRGWLEVLPGAATVLGGLLLLSSRNRATAMFGGWLTVLAGAWFVVGRPLSGVLDIGDPGKPIASSAGKFAALDIAYFSGLGVVIVFLGALALGRLSVRTLRDIEYAQRPVSAAEPVPVARTPVAETMRERETERAEEPSVTERGAERGAEPETEQVATPAAEEAPRHRRVGGFFRRRRETTTTR